MLLQSIDEERAGVRETKIKKEKETRMAKKGYFLILCHAARDAK